tara:strand:+ start:1577 stop:1690 length:114 start_codon:yes stop_codon:yes gene_type:complete
MALLLSKEEWEAREAEKGEEGEEEVIIIISIRRSTFW